MSIAIACAASTASAQSFPADVSWTALQQAGAPLGDGQGDGNGNGRDLVGDAVNPAVYLASDASFLYVRLRLDEDPTQTGTLRSFGWGLAVDTDDNFADYEYLVMVDGITDTVALAQNTVGTGIGDAGDATEVDLFTTPVVMGTNVVVAVASYPLPPSLFGTTPDYFLDVAVPWTALTAAGLTPTTPVHLIAGTSNTGRSLTVDLSGTPTAPGTGSLAASAADEIPLGLIEAPPTDTDGDGLDDDIEDANGNDIVDPGETDPADADSDNDGLSDGAEDADHDGTRDPGETSPLVADTDGGGVDDGDEVMAGTDPLDPSDDVTSTPEDGDGDGVDDDIDNCIVIANQDQADVDGDGLGDACDNVDDRFGLQGGGGCSTGGTPGLALAVVLALIIFGRRRRPLVFATLFAMPSVAHAQMSTQLTLDQFRLATGAGGLLDVEWGEVGTPRSWTFAASLDLADDQLVLVDLDGNRRAAIVDHRVTTRLSGSLVLTPWLALGAELPLVIAQGGDVRAELGNASLDATAQGNMRIVPTLELLEKRLAKRDPRDPATSIGIAVLPALSLPTATSSDFVGQRSVEFAPELAVSYRVGHRRMAINVGYRFRDSVHLADVDVGNAFYYRAGVGYRIAKTELAATSMISNDGYTELLASVHHDLSSQLTGFVAAGGGLTIGVGTPDWRIVVGTRMNIGASTPVAIRVPEPRREEPLPPPAAASTDADGDGIANDLDACPVEAEDPDDFESDDGCPDPDDDHDGVADAADKCPRTAGVLSAQGCAEPDRDGDGVLDRVDNCPDTAGQQRFAGCTRRQRVVIAGSKVELFDNVHFATAKATILDDSRMLIANLAVVLHDHPELALVRVEGHTDDRGDDAANLELSQQRAKAVVDELVELGVPASRLEAVGLGETRPLVPNTTEDGRARNRRVEIVIARREVP